MKRLLLIVPVIAVLAAVGMAPAQAEDGPPVQTEQGATTNQADCPTEAPLIGEALTAGVLEQGSLYRTFRISVDPGETKQFSIYLHPVPINGDPVVQTSFDLRDASSGDCSKFAQDHTGPLGAICCGADYPDQTPVLGPGEYFLHLQASIAGPVPYLLTAD